MLSISVSGLTECVGCAYEATDDFKKNFQMFFEPFFISIHKNGNRFMLAILNNNNITILKNSSKRMIQHTKIELGNLVRSYRGLEKYYNLNDKIEDTGEKEEIDDIGDEIGDKVNDFVEGVSVLGDEIGDLGDKVKDFVEGESIFKKIYEEGLDNQSMVDLWGLREYKNDKPTASKQEPLNI